MKGSREGVYRVRLQKEDSTRGYPGWLKFKIMRNRNKTLLSEIRSRIELDDTFREELENFLKREKFEKEERAIIHQNNTYMYYIYNTGDIKRVNPSNKGVHIMNPKIRKGYLTVNIDSKCFTVHRLLALNFLPLPEDFKTKKYVVDHIDGNSLNNELSNLRWCTQSENLMNKRSKSNTTSVYKGVYVAITGSIHFEIQYKGIRVRRGRIKTEHRASQFFDVCAMYLNSYIRTNHDKETYSKEFVKRFGDLYLSKIFKSVM